MIRNLTLLLATLLLPLLIFAQQPVVIKGVLTGDNGAPVQGATVVVKGHNKKALTLDDGSFQLSLLPGNYTLLFTSVGLKKTEKKILVTATDNAAIRVQAERDHRELNEVTVSGKAAIQQVKETPYNVVALDAKSQYNSTLDLAHLLNKASGVRIREAGGVGSDMNITLNGFTGRNIRVFMDGVPMQGFGSAFQLNNIPVNLAERIEIYKGVVPIEFGADVLGGVINIVTNRTNNTTVDASYSYGSFNTHRTNLSFSHTFKSGINVQINAFQNYSDNNYWNKTQTYIFPESNGTNGSRGATMSTDSFWVKRFHDSYRNETVVAKVGVVGKKWADRLLFGVTLGQVHRDVQNQADMKYMFGEVTTFNKSVLPSLTYEKRNLIVNGLSVRLNANYNYQRGGTVDTAKYRYNWFGERQPRAGGEMGNAVLSDYGNSNQSANLNIGYRINESHSVSVSDNISGYTRKPVLDEIEAPTAMDSMSRSSLKNTLGLEYRYTHKRKWNTIVFGKHYLNQVAGPQSVSGSTSNVYRRKESAGQIGYGIASTYFLKDLQVKFSVENAYRLPTENELFGDELLEGANLALRPEKSTNYNLGATLNKELSKKFTLYVDGSVYYRNTHDFIRRSIGVNSQTGAYIFTNTNHGHVTNMGVDLEVRGYYKNKFTLGVTGTYMRMLDKEPYMYTTTTSVKNPGYGYRMPNIPYFFGAADATYYIHNLFGKGNTLSLNYAFNFVERMFLLTPSMGDFTSKNTIPRQMSSDFSASYMMVGGKYNIAFEARNIENAFLYDNFSLQKPGRSFNIKFRYYLIVRKHHQHNKNQ